LILNVYVTVNFGLILRCVKVYNYPVQV